MPDLYQGSELWHRALVDPDNRRLVDYACRQTRLDACDRMDAAAVLARMDEGLPKLWTTSRALRLKARHAALADPTSSYAPLEIRGPAAARAVGFLRGGESRGGGPDPRLGAGLDRHPGAPARRPLAARAGGHDDRRRSGRPRGAVRRLPGRAPRTDEDTR